MFNKPALFSGTIYESILILILLETICKTVSDERPVETRGEVLVVN